MMPNSWAAEKERPDWPKKPMILWFGGGSGGFVSWLIDVGEIR